MSPRDLFLNNNNNKIVSWAEPFEPCGGWGLLRTSKPFTAQILRVQRLFLMPGSPELRRGKALGKGAIRGGGESPRNEPPPHPSPDS